MIYLKQNDKKMTLVTDAQKKATLKWNKNNLDRIQLVVKKGQKDQIKKIAKKHNKSLNGYIIDAIKEYMKKDNIDL